MGLVLFLGKVLLISFVGLCFMIIVINEVSEILGIFIGIGVLVLIVSMFSYGSEMLTAPPYTNLVKSEQIVAMSDKYITTTAESDNKIKVLYYTKGYYGEAVETNAISCNEDDILILPTNENFRVETYSNKYDHNRYVFYLPNDIINSEILTNYVIVNEIEGTNLEIYKDLFLNEKGR